MRNLWIRADTCLVKSLQADYVTLWGLFIWVFPVWFFFQFCLFSRRNWHFPDRAFHQLFLENKRNSPLSCHGLSGRSPRPGFQCKTCIATVMLIFEATVTEIKQNGCFFKLTIPFLKADALGYVPLPLGSSHRLSKEPDWFCLHLPVDIYL